MSAETLREAARLMRGNALAAMTSLSDNVPEWHSVGSLMGDGKTEGDATLIASWHPAVALTVADLLHMAADHLEGRGNPCDSCVEKAAEVARAYLGEVTP